MNKESEDRHKLDSVVVFFQLLAVTNMPTDSHKVFDFYHDHWRPVLYWYAKKLEEGYEKYEVNRRFDNQPNLSQALKLLDDKKYYNPQSDDNFSVDNIEEHPVIKCYKTNQPDEIPC